MRMVESESKTDILVSKYFPKLKKKKSMEWLNHWMKMLSAKMVIWEAKSLLPKHKAMRQKNATARKKRDMENQSKRSNVY